MPSGTFGQPADHPSEIRQRAPNLIEAFVHRTETPVDGIETLVHLRPNARDLTPSDVVLDDEVGWIAKGGVRRSTRSFGRQATTATNLTQGHLAAAAVRPQRLHGTWHDLICGAPALDQAYE